MKLLIVVDKLLTGFGAFGHVPVHRQEHARSRIVPAICRVNRLDDESKEHGYIVDYKDLFNSIEGAFDDYTGDALMATTKPMWKVCSKTALRWRRSVSKNPLSK